MYILHKYKLNMVFSFISTMKLSLFLKVSIYFVILVKLYQKPHLNSMKHKNIIIK